MGDNELEEQVRKTIETILNDPDPDLRMARIDLMFKLLNTPGNRAIEEACHLRDLMGLPWPPLEEAQRIVREANEAARVERRKNAKGNMS
jgi:hypothetical protein